MLILKGSLQLVEGCNAFYLYGTEVLGGIVYPNTFIACVGDECDLLEYPEWELADAYDFDLVAHSDKWDTADWAFEREEDR
jgi:hypothetical protein